MPLFRYEAVDSRGRMHLRGVGHAALTTFTRQLSTLLDAGLPIARALDILAHQQKPGLFKSTLDRVRVDLEGGMRLSECLGRQPRVFDRLYVNMDGERISDISFEGSGCAISVASASIMTEFLKGRTAEEARELFGLVHDLLTNDTVSHEVDRLGKVVALAGVRQFPSRVKCASLCWHALTAALDHRNQPVSTE